MQQFVNTTLTGVTLGAVYAAFALALVLIWRSTRVVNFAQAAMAMVTTLLAASLIESGTSYWLAFVVALGSGFLLGAVIERLIVRRVEGGPELNAVILTLGLFIVLTSGAEIVFGSQFRTFPAPFGLGGTEIGGTTYALTGYSIFVLVAVLATMGLLLALFQFTDVGLRMRAAAHQPEVARLLGVRVGRMLTLGWGLAAVVGSLSGLLIGGGSLVHPHYMESTVVFGFVAAVLGGLDSPAGAVVGGLLLGLALTFVSGYAGSGLVALAALAILVAVLMVRPGGLFSTAGVRRV